jgi:hypothetical protein
LPQNQRKQRILKKCVKVKPFLQVYDRKTSREGETEPAAGPDCEARDTLETSRF